MTRDPPQPPETAQSLSCHPLLQSHDFTMTSNIGGDQRAPHPTRTSDMTIFGGVLGAAGQTRERETRLRDERGDGGICQLEDV